MTQALRPNLTMTNKQADFAAVIDALNAGERFLVTTHENPDGDALGSLLAMTTILRSLGKDVAQYLSGEAPLPAEYGFLNLEELSRVLPADASERIVVAVDCANERRIGSDTTFLGDARQVIDIDHHHDNTRFGAVNLVVGDASSTAEIMRDVAAAVGVPLTRELAEQIYIGLVTDTGRFQYSNTTPKAHRLAAELVDAGADVNGIFQAIYETVQLPKLKLLGRALEHAQPYEGGRLVIAHLHRSDFADAGATEPFSEGVIDYLRQAEGAEVVGLIREPPPHAGGPPWRVSLRSRREDIDVSAIARGSGGGGHRQAAGFSHEGPLEAIMEFIHQGFLAADAAART